MPGKGSKTQFGIWLEILLEIWLKGYILLDRVLLVLFPSLKGTRQKK
jgi:hypothetical protein